MPILIGLKNSNFDEKKNVPVLCVNSGPKNEITTERILSKMEDVFEDTITEEAVRIAKESRFYLSEKD